jgi:monofunctional biosynthetic peptidoglycan transglycosylase
MKPALRGLFLLVLALLGLQLYFALRIGAMAYLDPESTAFERSALWRISTAPEPGRWQQEWVPYDQISRSLKSAVLASEDDGFASHGGVDWDAINAAWQKNAKAQARAEARSAAAKGRSVKPPKIIGGSTITQQLAKNLFLSGERTIVRKAQELVITLLLEVCLSKERILEIYLNHVEWGDGVFGAQAASWRYYRKDASRLAPNEAARLAVMLPRPKFFEKLPASDYLANRSALIQGRMADAQLP